MPPLPEREKQDQEKLNPYPSPVNGRIRNKIVALFEQFCKDTLQISETKPTLGKASKGAEVNCSKVRTNKSGPFSHNVCCGGFFSHSTRNVHTPAFIKGCRKKYSGPRALKMQWCMQCIFAFSFIYGDCSYANNYKFWRWSSCHQVSNDIR